MPVSESVASHARMKQERTGLHRGGAMLPKLWIIGGRNDFLPGLPVGNHGDRINLNERPREDVLIAHFNHRAGRGILGEAFPPNLFHPGKQSGLGQEHFRLDHMVQAGPGGLEDPPEVPQNAFRLELDIRLPDERKCRIGPDGLQTNPPQAESAGRK